MSDDFQSIEDLMSKVDNDSLDEDTVQGKLKLKQKEILRGELEESTERRARQQGVRYISLLGFPISPEALTKLTEKQSRRLKAVCFLYNGKEIRIGALEINDEVKATLNKLVEELHCQGQLYLISQLSFKRALLLYKNLPKPKIVIRGIKITEADLNQYSEKFSSFKDLREQIEKADISQTVTMMLAASIKSRTSDVHIECEEKEIKLRFRIDGVLHDAAILKTEAKDKIISRLKILAHVKINISDRPQDGRFTIYMSNRRIDIRISFLPTAYGESVVMRMLDSSHRNITFEELGLRGRSFKQLQREISRPNGMIITTGPTGSGKTTTLYAILQKLNQPKTKIITIEDPVEYQMPGINQSEVSDNFTFSKGLRSIVRQDPDIIMVGEIRDLETAQISVQAALTGHLVLSTIHTNDAAGTVPRLLSMGVKPFLLGPALNVMVGQRLVRRVCDNCKKEIKLTEVEHRRIEEIINSMPAEEKKSVNLEKANFFIGNGCDACQGLGYKGRLGIYEVMTMTPAVEKLIQQSKVSAHDLIEIAIKDGMMTMVQDGILKALEGLTTVSEVLRVAE